jgi:hypothetical protein
MPLGVPPDNVLWSVRLPVSTSYCVGSGGVESKSVDVKNCAFSGFLVVAAAGDNGLSLFDQGGGLIWNFWDGSPETVVRISQDGGFIVCGGCGSGIVHYFSHLRDGVAGWGPNDGLPLWSFGGAGVGLYAFWTAVSGLGDYVAVSAYPTPVTVNQSRARVLLLNRTGSVVWSYELPRSGFVKVDMPCNGRSVMSVNDDGSETQGCVLNYWADSADSALGWSAGDSDPVWTYWPGKEVDDPPDPLDDFHTVAVSDNGGYVAIGGVPVNAYVLTGNGVLQQKMGVMLGAVQSVDLTFDGRFGASGDDSGSVWFFNNAAGLEWSRLTGGRVNSVVVSKVYPSLLPFPDHDVAVDNVTTCKDGCVPKSTVSQNYTAHVWVEVENQGDFSAAFMVRAYANNSLVTSMTVNLNSGERVTIAFVWNTTGFAIGNYTITASAEVVQDEVDVANNAWVRSGFVKVCGVGDVNGDDRCDFRDLGAVSSAYCATPGTPNWNTNADINDDHVVNMRDLGIVSNNYGKQY